MATEQEHMKLITADYQVINEELQRALTTSTLANIPQYTTMTTAATGVPSTSMESKESESNRLFSLYETLVLKENIAEPKLISSINIFRDWINQAKITYLIDENELEKIIESIGKLGNVIEGDLPTTA